MSWPDAEVPVDEDLVRGLLRVQHPDLADLPLEQFDAGWDNVMWRLGDDLAVRLPRREAAAHLIEQEQRWLPELAPRLSLPVPVPLRVGRPGPGYPWHWSVVPWLAGVPGDRAPVTDAAVSAGRLGSFLHQLHAPAPSDAPHNPWRSGPVASRADTFEDRMARLAAHVDGFALRRIWESAVSASPYSGPPVWIHGDLHPANTLVVEGTIAGVIDFGDMCAGDPAADLGAASMSFPIAGLPSLWAGYGGVDPDLARRANGWSVLFGLLLLDIGLQGRPTYADVGRAALGRVACAVS